MSAAIHKNPARSTPTPLLIAEGYLEYDRLVSGVIVQIFGKKKCADTRKAERWFKERGIRVQSIELTEKGLSPNELKSVAARVGGPEALLDRECKRYVDKGLKYSAPT